MQVLTLMKKKRDAVEEDRYNIEEAIDDNFTAPSIETSKQTEGI